MSIFYNLREGYRFAFRPAYRAGVLDRYADEARAGQLKYLVRRVSNQRRELKNLHRLVEHLEGNGWGRRADAWEEGYRAGHSCVGADPACCREPNPYVPDVLRSLKSYPYGGVK